MESPGQQLHRHHEGPRLETSDSALSARAPLTSTTLRELRRGDANASTAQTVSPMMSRRTSLDSDRFSTVSGLTIAFPSNPANVNPPPAYIAPFGASQVVTEHQSSRRRVSSDEEDDFKHKDDVQFSDTALALVNAFLDQLLYSFLSTARSTSLLALRPAVTEVLKHRLAKEAIASAEEELAELLAGGDDEDEMNSKQKLAEESRKWDLELVWKRTRLRVMVYMRLGEMEDEDEQRYVKEEELFQGSERRFSQSSGLVSWAAAIFLTSVLEYVAEQTLQVAGQAAHTRARRQSRARAATGAQTHGYLMVEDYDVEKVALNSTLGRLWRSWRKALRGNASVGTPTHRSSTSIGRIRDNMVSAMSHRRSSFGTAHEGVDSRPTSRDQKDDVAEIEYPEHVLAANIPLPIGNSTRDMDEIAVPGLAKDPEEEHDDAEIPDEPYADHELGRLLPLPLADDKRDVDEIEVPGLARDPDEEDDDTVTVTSKDALRRNSYAGATGLNAFGGLPTPENSIPSSPEQAPMSPIGRQRSMSLPTPARTPRLGEDSEEKTLNEEPLENEDGFETAPSTAQPVAGEKSDGEFPWMVGGATVATAATAATAGAWAVSSSNGDGGEQSELTNSTNEAEAQPKVGRRLPGLFKEDSQDEPISQESVTPNSVLDAHKGTSQRSLSVEDIEELDKRKSLVDIKSMMIVNGPSNPTSGQESPAKPQSPMRSESSGSYALGSRSIGVSEVEGPDDAIGVARTGDLPATAAIPRTTDSSLANGDTREARGVSSRPGRLILADSTRTFQSPDNQGQPLTPRSQQRQFLDLTSDAQAEPDVPVERNQSRSPSKHTQRASLANGAQKSPSVGTSPNRQSFAAPVETNGTATSLHQKNGSSGSQVQDHPVIQRMASLKASEPKSPKAPMLVNEPEKSVPLTSASIRGPEDFDMFVQGVDTLKYTLTPENVRYEPGESSVALARKRLEGGSPVEMDAASSRVGRSLVPKQVRTPAEEEEYRKSKRRSLSRPSATNTSANRKSGLMAREPRVMTESTRDFADFIRSTGPDKDTTPVPILANASTTSLHSLRSAHINGASASREASRSSSPTGERSRSLQKKSMDGTAVPPVPAIPGRAPGRSKTTMQPRGATSVSDGSNDLIDFIRSGPDEAGKHRISRTVAPFRNTMDSDQFRDLGARPSTDKAQTRAGAPSVQSVSSMKSSHRTSANSRSALLSGPTAANQTSQPAYSGQPQTLTGTTKPTQEGKRTQYRNKDPYAMYDMSDDDDEDDFLTSLPRAMRGEESFMDFLNNSEPPAAASPPQPLINPNSAQAKSIISNARANGMISQKSTTGPPERTRSMPTTSAPRSGQATPVSTVPSRQTTMTSVSGSRKMQARGGAKDIASTSNTRELADFLKSGPPEDADSAPAPSVGTRGSSKEIEKAKKKAEKKRSGSSFFGRSKKKTYLDMP